MRQNGPAVQVVTIRIYYDFASTLCYVAHRVLGRIEGEVRELGVALEWRPIDLTMAAPWDRGDSFRPDIRAAVRNTGLALGIDVEMPDPWLDSRPASQVALSLRTPEDEARWRRAVFDTFFDRKTPRLTPELERLARDLTGLATIPDESQGFERVEECTREAIALGVTGVPSFLLDNWLFGGVYDDELMVSILRQLSTQYRESGSEAVN
jgi:predicted DsbA family dithiol-disulfide isomerase